jgi:hypothetical protein
LKIKKEKFNFVYFEYRADQRRINTNKEKLEEFINSVSKNVYLPIVLLNSLIVRFYFFNVGIIFNICLANSLHGFNNIYTKSKSLTNDLKVGEEEITFKEYIYNNQIQDFLTSFGNSLCIYQLSSKLLILKELDFKLESSKDHKFFMGGYYKIKPNFPKLNYPLFFFISFLTTDYFVKTLKTYLIYERLILS